MIYTRSKILYFIFSVKYFAISFWERSSWNVSRANWAWFFAIHCIKRPKTTNLPNWCNYSFSRVFRALCWGSESCSTCWFSFSISTTVHWKPYSNKTCTTYISLSVHCTVTTYSLSFEPAEPKKQLQIHLDPSIQNAFTQLFQVSFTEEVLKYVFRSENESQQLFQIHRIVPAQFPLSIFRLLKGVAPNWNGLYALWFEKDLEQPQEQIQNNTDLRVIREKSQDESQTQTPSLQVIFHNS